MSLTVRILAALLVGLAGGFLLASVQPGAVPAVTATTDVIGTLWLNGIRMTVIPLVVALLLSSVTSVADPATLQRVGSRTGRVFLFLIMGIVAVTMALALTALQFWPPALSPIAKAGPALAPPPPFSQWLISLIPANPLKAATDGAMLPLIIFTLLVAFALLRLPVAQRQPVVQLFQTLADVMLVILRWVLWVAPAGVFAVSLSLAARQGLSALGALAFYVGMLVAIVILITIALYAVAVFWSGIPLRRFAAALAPAQSVAGPTLSSLAALPLLVDGAERILGYPRATAGLVLPLTVSILRPAAPVAQIVAALFTAQWNGIVLVPVDLLTLGAVVTLMSFATPGVPNASFLVMIPVFQAIGLPIEGIGLMLAVDVFPDFAKTILNVTGHLTALTLIHHAPAIPHPAAEPAPLG